jgi:hypothetical protein
MIRILRRIYLLPMIILMTVSMLWAASDQRDFRQTTWGMNSSQIIASEGKQPEDQKASGSLQYLVYLDEIANLHCHVLYVLAYDKLVHGMYQITETHTNNTDYLSDYNKLKEALLNKYGTPVKDIIDWKDDLYKSDPPHWGTAVAVGHMRMFTFWKTPRTEITLALFGDNFNISLGIDYSSKLLSFLEKKAQDEKNASKF